jgi:hypothetical protein
MMKISIHCATLVVGLCLVVYAGVSQPRPIAVWSDFKAFSARIARDESARHVLTYGGEKEETDFDYLLKRVRGLSDDWKPVIWAALLLCVLGGRGISQETRHNRRKRTIEQSHAEATSEPARDAVTEEPDA